MTAFLNKLFEPRDNGPEIAKLFLDLQKCKISRTTITKEIEEHPDYPSLLSISDVLTSYGIENLTASFDPNKLSNLPVPFITQIKYRNALIFFTVVKEISNKTINFFEPQKQEWETGSLNDFYNLYTGYVLLSDIPEGVLERDYVKNILEEKRSKFFKNLMLFCIPAIVFLTGIVNYIEHGTGAFLPFLFTIVTFAGCAITALLIWFEVDQYNPVLQKICVAGKKVNCSAILQSNASKIAGISWSAIGFAYFFAELLLLLFSGLAPQALFITSWLNVLAIPYVFYSIYYQWQVAKQWCILCLYVQGLLILQLSITLVGGWHKMPINSIGFEWLTQPLMAFVLPFMMIALLLPALKKAKENKYHKIELQRIKHNPLIFEALLTKQKAIKESIAGLGIILGNSDAKYKILKVCNPYCKPCSDAHSAMEELINNNSDVQIQIIFFTTNDDRDRGAFPVKHFMAIADQKDDPLLNQALDDWYNSEKKDYSLFAAKYPIKQNLELQGPKLESMYTWCKKSDIAFTPTFFINGYQLPEKYSINDLKYFLTV